MLHAVRQEMPCVSLHLDVEGGMRDENVMSLCLLQDFMPWMVEQALPADDFVGNSDLAQVLHTRIGLDESVTSVNAAKTLVRLGGVKCLKVNPVRVGGMDAVKEILALCRENEVDAWISCPPQTGIGAGACLAAACLNGVTGPFEYHDPKRVFAVEVPGMPMPVRDEEDGLLRITPGEGAGIGVEWNG